MLQAELLECIKELLRVEREWVPDEEGFSVYIRPTLIGTHPFLGVCPTMEAMLFVVLSPVGPYFPSGLKPVKLFVDTENVRAFPGGVGDKKIGGNYAPTLLPQLHSSRRGCSQVCNLVHSNTHFVFSSSYISYPLYPTAIMLPRHVFLQLTRLAAVV